MLTTIQDYIIALKVRLGDIQYLPLHSLCICTRYIFVVVTFVLTHIDEVAEGII